MATIITIQESDQISNSRADLNTNFANLDSDKIETSVIDTDTAMAADSDAKIPSQKAVKTYIDTQGGANASTTVRGVVEEATDAEVAARTTTGGTGARLYINPGSLSQVGKFGGDGSDGALSVTSGTTTIDLGSAKLVMKNYTSISITGTGNVTFSNPHAEGTMIILNSQGAVTITSSATRPIDARGFGAIGGTGGTGSTGTVGTNSWLRYSTNANAGQAGTSGAGGAAGLQYQNTELYSVTDSDFASIPGNYRPIIGSGGASGSGNGTEAGGNGGRGGAGLIINCGGALNFTTGTIDTSGSVGSNGTDAAGGNRQGAGGGGGGSAGSCLILYRTLTSSAGTVACGGGAGGNGGSRNGTGGSGINASGGGGAGGFVAAGGAGNTTNSSGNAAAGAGSGGGGAGGDSDGTPDTGGAAGATMGGLVMKNYWYA
jgi:hypothetical protein